MVFRLFVWYRCFRYFFSHVIVIYLVWALGSEKVVVLLFPSLDFVIVIYFVVLGKGCGHNFFLGILSSYSPAGIIDQSIFLGL